MKKMIKKLSITLLSTMILVACGDESLVGNTNTTDKDSTTIKDSIFKADSLKNVKDSIAKVDSLKIITDSLSKVDSIAKTDSLKAITDSIAKVDSIMIENGKVIKSTIQSCGMLPSIQSYNRQDSISTTQATDSDYSIHTFKVNLSESWDDISTLGANDDIIYPGSLIDGKTLANLSLLKPITLDREPITVSLSLEGTVGTGNLSTIINNPTLSSVRNGVRELVTKNASSSIPIKMELSEEFIYSQDQLSASLDLPLVGSTISSNLGLNWSNTSIKSRKVYTFKQKAYSVDMNTPTSFISNSNRVEAVKTALTGTIPTYVSSVDYGAVLYVVVESELDEKQIEGKLGGLMGGTISPLDSKTNVKVVQYGGDANLSNVAQSMIEGGGTIKAVNDYLASQTMGNSLAVPLSYKLRYVSDNTIAQIGTTTSYTKKVYVKTSQTVQVVVDSLRITSSDGGEVGALDNLYSYVKISKVAKGVKTVVDTYTASGNDISNSVQTWVKPNKSYSVHFKNFDPLTDYISIEMYGYEDDAIDDDFGTSTSDFRYENWDKQGTISVGTDGPDFRAYLTFIKL